MSSFDQKLAAMIDHTLLKPEATPAEIKKLCEEAKQYGFATVCINSCYVSLAAKLLKGSKVKPIAVIGFPLGAMSTAAKVFETKQAIKDGAREIDMVINIGWLKAGETKKTLEDIRSIVKACRKKPLKVILETAKLNEAEKIQACKLSKKAGAAFVKTCTGFGGGGATVEDIRLMRATVGPKMGVKASGGIRSRADALQLIEAGATRLGTSGGVQIVSETHVTELNTHSVY